VIRITGQNSVAELVGKTILPRKEGDWYSIFKSSGKPAGWACACHGAPYKCLMGMAVAVVRSVITAEEPNSCRQRPTRWEVANSTNPLHVDFDPQQYIMKDELIARAECITGQLRNLVDLLKLTNNHMMDGLKLATQSVSDFIMHKFDLCAQSNAVATLWLDDRVPTIDVLQQSWSEHDEFKDKGWHEEAKDPIFSTSEKKAGIMMRVYDLTAIDEMNNGSALSNGALCELLWTFTDAMDANAFHKMTAAVMRLQSSEDQTGMGECRKALIRISNRRDMWPGPKLAYMEDEIMKCFGAK
jgi:hypothetical protein